MNQVINTCITCLNNIGQGFWYYAAGIFIQSSVLIILLLIVDFLLRKRVRAVFRYCLWMLVFIKLVLPASFTLPTGIGYWLGDYFPSGVSMAKWIPQTEEIVPITLNIHQRSIPLEPIVTNETAVIDIYQGSIPLEPVVTNETAVIGIELEPICWQGLVFLGWLVGMIVLLALLVKRIYFVRGLIAQSRPANERSLRMLEECRCQIGIRRNIELRLSGNTLSPAVCGLFNPVILMPSALLKKLSREKLKAVLIHELAHIKRGDAWVNLLQTILQIVYFYNPFLWIANAMVRRAREQAVDEMVLVTLKPETKSYSNTLIDIAEMAFWRPNFSLSIIGVVESKKALERRIEHMLNRPVPKSSKLGYRGLIAIIVIGTILLPMGSRASNTQSRVYSETNTIVPGLRVGDYTLDMSKDEVLKRLGKPEAIFFGGERYTLNNLPRRYYMSFGDISFGIDGDSVTGIGVHSPLYKFTNGLGVGDSEQKIKQAFGDDFHLNEGVGKDFLTYEDKGLQFEIHKNTRTVIEIGVTQTKRNQDDSTEAPTPSRLEPFDNVGGKDLRTHDLRNEGPILDTLEFNQETQWPPPERLPEGFDPQVLLKEGMNPGLGVRDLHAQGITGAGVHVGLIDQPLLLDHPEYAGKVVSYYALDCGPNKSSMHGPAMASQLVGKRCGTAPGANLHVVAVPSWKADAGYYARALDRFVAYNENVPKEQKIRVVSVSCQPSGEGSVFENQPLWDEAVQRAQAEGILVLDCTWHHGFVSLCWLDPQNRESVEACTPGFRNGAVEIDEGHIHVPSAPRTAAEADEERSFGYAYDGGGRRSRRPKAKNGYSDTIPYTAGILALGWQIRPDLTPAQIKEMLFASAYVHKSGARIINPTAFIDLVRNQSGNQQIRTRPQTYSETRTIVPGVRVGNYTLDMSKDDVLKKLGEPKNIHYGGERYTLNNLPRKYFMSFGDISFTVEDDTVTGIGVNSPLYKFTNGLGVGDSEEKIKQAFGNDFELEEYGWKDQLNYEGKGLQFEIRRENRTVIGIDVYQAEGNQQSDRRSSQDLSAIVRQAAAQGRISFKLTTPDEFKAIAGQPTREWTDGDDVICMEYPGIMVRFFGKPNINAPHTLISLSCEGREIDIGQNRPIALRNEKDLDKFGPFWGYCAVDLSRLDLSQEGNLLEGMPFDSLTVWPEPDLLPPGFEPRRRLEQGKNPGLGVRYLHQEGINGSGVGIAIIDQPLLRDHVEYGDRIKSYHAIEVEGVDIQMHGPPVCSISVGKTCGIAPRASLHYYAVPPWKWLENRPWARVVEQIVERNRNLPRSEKVRVISISLGMFSQRDHYDQWQAVVDKAVKDGILVVTCDPDFMPFGTLKRIVGTDPDDPNCYSYTYGGDGTDPVYVPIANRTIASAGGKDVYTFDTRGGASWAVPYLAGLAALAFQVHPGISPDQIVKLWQETASRTQLGPVVNPRGFIEAVKRLKQRTPR